MVRFLQRMENLSFTEAIEQLGERFGVTVEFEEGAEADSGAQRPNARLLLLLEKAAAFYERFLWETEGGQAAREYLENRGLDEEICRAFRVGMSPDEWRGLHKRAVKQGFTDREMEEAGLLVSQPGKTYDRFRGRLMFPLVDHRGRVVGFGGRTLKDETPKYLNSPEGPLYQKGHLLYGLYQARRAIADSDEVVVVEGYTDVIGLAQAGVQNVVASMGTALTDAQIGLMTRFTKNITFMFDADRAGTEAMLRSGELARRHELRPTMAVLPADEDPADVAIKGGAEAVAEGAVRPRPRSWASSCGRRWAARTPAIGRAGAGLRAGQAHHGARLPRSRSGRRRSPYVADRLRLYLRQRRAAAGGGTREGAAGAGAEAGRSADLPADDDGRSTRRASLSIEQEFLVAAACHPRTPLPMLAGAHSRALHRSRAIARYSGGCSRLSARWRAKERGGL